MRVSVFVCVCVQCLFSMFLQGIRSPDPFHGNQRVEISPGSHREPD